MKQDFNSAISPWAAASPFGVEARPDCGREVLELLAEAGATWVQTQLAPWPAVERRAGFYQFAPESERFAEACVDADMQLVSMLDHGNHIYTSADEMLNGPIGPLQIEAYAEYVRAAVGHYQRWVKYWQVWTGPKTRSSAIHFLLPGTFVDLLRASHQAAKGTDPRCKLVGALSAADLASLEHLLSCGGAQWLDVVSVRKPAPGPATEQARVYLDELTTARELTTISGRSLPLWLTVQAECSETKGASPLNQQHTAADALVRGTVLGFAAGAVRVFWPSPLAPSAQCAGTLMHGGRSSLAAYRTMACLLRGAQCTGLIAAPNNVWAVGFRRLQREILVCWAAEGIAEVELLGAELSRWDTGGNAWRPADGPLRIPLGPSPLFVSGYSLAVAAT